MAWEILQGDVRDKLQDIPDNTFDACITDPPYELGFMGKKWDSTGIAYNVEMWREVLRVLKPGGHLLSFGGSRTYHRMACAIEDAGFEIRDQIMWIYGSGFPKSQNIGKAIDKKPYITERVKIKEYIAKHIDLSGKSKKQIDNECGFNACAYTRIAHRDDDNWGVALPTEKKWQIMKYVIGFDNTWDSVIVDIEREITGRGMAGLTKGKIANFAGETEFDITSPATPEAIQWEGWGSALKPAHEPIVLARKPLSEKTIAANVLKWGTGGINIDGCRVYRDCDDKSGWIVTGSNESENRAMSGKNYAREAKPDNESGRFPANLIHDGSEEVHEEFGKAGDKKAGGKVKGHEPSRTGDNGIYGKWDRVENNPFDDIGSAARFFYCAKASKSERNMGCEGLAPVTDSQMTNRQEGSLGLDWNNGKGGNAFAGASSSRGTERKNHHPTVKPMKLMEYLIRLVTPPGGKILDPFAGSGTTLLVAENMGINSVGVEITPEYVKLIEKRMSNFQQTIFSL